VLKHELTHSFRRTEIARPRAHLAAGRRRAMDGRAPQHATAPGRWWNAAEARRDASLSERWKARGWGSPGIRLRFLTRGRWRWWKPSSIPAASATSADCSIAWPRRLQPKQPRRKCTALELRRSSRADHRLSQPRIPALINGNTSLWPMPQPLPYMGSQRSEKPGE
jgi:hypothetical protein